MYEVRWSLTSGEVCKESFNESFDAWKKFHAIADRDDVVSIGLYAIDRNGGEHEMECWSL